MSKLFGAHINDDPNKINDEIDRIKSIGGNIVQLFVDPYFKNLVIYDKFKNKLKENNMSCVVHASYTINLANEWDEYNMFIKQFIDELELANKIGAKGIVVHMGKQLNLSKAEAYNNMFSSLIYVHNKTKKYVDTKILLETSSGQGSELCYRIEDFAYFFKKFSLNKNQEIKDRFGIVLDTAHIFASGYDLRTKIGVDIYLDTVEELIGIDYVKLIHLNDSRMQLGSNVDRHENLGKGYIGSVGLKYFSDYFKDKKIPIILETPYMLHKTEIEEYSK